MSFNDNFLWYLKCTTASLLVGGVTYKLYFKFWKEKSVSLKGKVVLITGASSGIGESLAHAFYEQGCKVVLASRREAELLRVKSDLLAKNLSIETTEPTVFPLDLADLNQMVPFVKKVYDKYDTVDILVNNGGVSYRGSILNTKLEVERQIMEVNYFGTVALTKAFLPRMVTKKSGHIVFISSILGLISLPDRSAYATSKHAMQAFGDSLRAEMDQHNIDVTVVSPGYIRTSILLNGFNETGGRLGLADPKLSSGFSAEYCAKKILEAVKDKKNEILVSQFETKVLVFLRRVIPSMFFRNVAERASLTEV